MSSIESYQSAFISDTVFVRYKYPLYLITAHACVFDNVHL